MKLCLICSPWKFARFLNTTDSKCPICEQIPPANLLDDSAFKIHENYIADTRLFIWITVKIWQFPPLEPKYYELISSYRPSSQKL